MKIFWALGLFGAVSSFAQQPVQPQQAWKEVCVEAYGKQKCGFGDCIQAYGKLECGSHPEDKCIEAYGNLACGYRCKEAYGKISCETRPVQAAAANAAAPVTVQPGILQPPALPPIVIREDYLQVSQKNPETEKPAIRYPNRKHIKVGLLLLSHPMVRASVEFPVGDRGLFGLNVGRGQGSRNQLNILDESYSTTQLGISYTHLVPVQQHDAIFRLRTNYFWSTWDISSGVLPADGVVAFDGKGVLVNPEAGMQFVLGSQTTLETLLGYSVPVISSDDRSGYSKGFTMSAALGYAF
ncbi:MAG: hypothetical protein JNL01_02995 [Bdellovibrionales bacterium]|nr:hypothetical protein [Bdellovibrionales bacterium]